MPPAHKTTKQEIIQTAINIAKEVGFSGITAREIGKRLGLSSRPIYSFYPSMNELITDFLKNILILYKNYLMSENRESDDSFFNMGIGQIQFAREEPQLYKIVMEKFTLEDFEALQLHKDLIEKIQNDKYYSSFPQDMIEDFLLKMGLFTEGLANAVLRGMLPDDSDDAIARLLYETGEAMLMRAYINSDGGNNEEFSNLKRKFRPGEEGD